MQRETFDEKQLGIFLVGSPKEGGRLNRSIINYHGGIPDLDDYLKDKKSTDLDAEFGLELFNNAVQFMLYRGQEVAWTYTLKRESIIDVISHHGKQLNIRKNSKVSGGVLGAIGAMGIMGGIVAGTVDALTSGKNIPQDQLVLGSVFEIVVKTEKPEPEKIIVSTTDNHKDNIENFLKVILAPKTEEKEGCYIATVCYNDINSPQVKKFRQFRDYQLNEYFVGRSFIKFYYWASPSISKYLKGKNKLNHFIRVYLLDKIYNGIK